MFLCRTSVNKWNTAILAFLAAPALVANLLCINWRLTSRNEKLMSRTKTMALWGPLYFRHQCLCRPLACFELTKGTIDQDAAIINGSSLPPELQAQDVSHVKTIIVFELRQTDHLFFNWSKLFWIEAKPLQKFSVSKKKLLVNSLQLRWKLNQVSENVTRSIIHQTMYKWTGFWTNNFSTKQSMRETKESN